MNTRKFLLVWVLLLVHLHAMAGELINITGLASLKPGIAVTITGQQVQTIKSNVQANAPGVLSLHLVTDGMAATTPVASTYTLDGNILALTPAYTLGGDMEFEVQYRNGTFPVVTKRFRTPAAKSSSIVTKVVTAYPLSDTIPYNTLFFHVRFSQPMSPDVEAFRYVHVYDDKGVERTKAWRQRSFWLDSGKLLVLMIHPGRVKNGIRHDGPLFDSGKHYTLAVDKDIKDENGHPVAAAYTKQYYIGSDDRVSPVANINTNKLPAANTLQPLHLSFSEGMDQASVVDGVILRDNNGEQLPCTIETLSDDRYRLIPLRKWKKAKYTVELKSAVYDFAANRIGRLFEITEPQDVEKDKLVTTLNFELK